jgi:branched-chain amino acid aminotransferase
MTKLIPFDDRDGYIWHNGQMIPWREAKTHVLSHGLHYGTGVFEGERSNAKGIVFKSKEHTERLFRSAEIIHLPMTRFSAENIEQAKTELLAANKVKTAYIRVLAFRGPEQTFVYPGDHAAHVIVAAWEWKGYFGDAEGITLQTSRWRKADPSSLPVEAKAAGNYVANVMLKQEAIKAGAYDALVLHLNGSIAESSAANIFFVDADGTLHTPIAKGRFLNGVTRLTVIDIARALSLNVVERDIWPNELPAMREVFVTGTAANVTPVVKIDAQDFAIGPITKRLMTAYADVFEGS